jgi:hypothetical protein
MKFSLIMLLIILSFLSGCALPDAVELREISHRDTPGWAHDIALDGNNIYVSDRQGGFLIFNRSMDFKLLKLANPVKDVISLSPNSGMPLLASRFEGLTLLSQLGSVMDRFSNGDIANAVEVRDGLAYAAFGLQGLVVMRLDDGRERLVSMLPARGWAHGLVLSGGQAFIADWQGVRVVDVKHPEKPVEVAFIQSPATCISVALQENDGGRMAASAEGHAGIALFSVDIVGKPTLIHREYLGLNPADAIHPKSGGWVHSVAFAGKYLFAANWKRGLTLLDAHDPVNMKILLEMPTSGTSLGVKTQLQPDGSYLVFLADGEAGLRVFQFRGK